MKQGIRQIDKTDGKQLEINFSSVYNFFVRMRAVINPEKEINDISIVAPGSEMNS